MNIREHVKATIRELEPAAQAGNSEAQYDLFVFLTAEAMEDLDHTLFDRAEHFLKEAAAQGHPKAVEALAAHDVRRYAFEGRCQRRKGSAS